ncbi:hypothetical protein D3C77_682070 [compost metagenome]
MQPALDQRPDLRLRRLADQHIDVTKVVETLFTPQTNKLLMLAAQLIEQLAAGPHWVLMIASTCHCQHR